MNSSTLDFTVDCLAVYSGYETKDATASLYSVNVDDLHYRFGVLSKEWKRETGKYSSVAKKLAHPAYRKIVEMGNEAIPLILAELAKQPDHWFEALEEIAGGINPVASSDYGNLKRMADAWLDWGKAHHYID